MRKRLLLSITLPILISSIHAQELKIIDNSYKSEFQVQVGTLSIDEIVAAFEINQLETQDPKVIYKNEQANVFIVEYFFNWMKDTNNRWWPVVIPCKCFLQGDSLKIVIENLMLQYYLTLDRDSEMGRTPIEKGKGNLSEESHDRLQTDIIEIHSSLSKVVNKAREYWDKGF